MADLWITLGPSSIDNLSDLIRAGVSGVRLTFSFGTPSLQEQRAINVKSTAEEIGTTCLNIADLPGEKVRLGMFDGDDTVLVEAGQQLQIVVSNIENPTISKRIPIPHPEF